MQWDTPGPERFRTISGSYIKAAHGLMIVYDITDRQTFDHVKNWITQIDKSGGKDAIKMLVGNKSDAGAKREVQTLEAQTFARELGMLFAETSALNSANVEAAFMMLASAVKDRIGGAPTAATCTVSEPAHDGARGGSAESTKEQGCALS